MNSWKMQVHLLTLNLVLLVPLLRAEIFTSVQDMKQIFTVERHFVDALADYAIKMEERLMNIRKYLSAYEQVRAEVDASGKNMAIKQTDDGLSERLAGNPIHAYHLMKRLTLNWKSIEEYDPNVDWRAVKDVIMKCEIFGFSQFNNEEDLKGAVKALIRLQNIYQLNTTSLVRGNVLGLQTAAELTAQDCIYLGQNSFNEGTYYNAIEWFEQAYNLAGMEKNKTITQDEVMGFLTSAIKAYETSQQNSTNEVKQPGISEKKIKLGKDMSDEDAVHIFAALCRGEQVMDDAYIATLKCYYDHRNASYLMLMPAKVEQRHHDPQILVFHEAIRDDEIELIKEISTPRLFRSTVQGTGGVGTSVSSIRTSKNAWMDSEDEMTSFRSLNLRISYLTGLLTSSVDNSAEPLQTANYGIGGHYVPHRDYLLKDKTEYELKHNIAVQELVQGDRLATFMFYLSNVNRGGATAFPNLGVSLFPEKGSAVFWYNLKKSGAPYESTLHGGCPVVHGSKWVTNKWIREHNQFRRRPCGLSEDD